MASIRQDVNALKRESMLQHTPSSAVDDDGAADETVDDSPHTAARPPGKNNNDSSPKTTCHSQSASWSEEMDVRDPLLDDDVPTKDSAPIKVVPVTSRTNDFLNEAFTKRMSGADRRSLRSQYILPQNNLTRAPFLDTMMGSECSKQCKSMDRSLYTLQGLLLEPIGPLSQLLEAVNDPDPQVSMDQIGEAVEMAITLLANTSNKLPLMRRARVLDEYNKELVTFAAEKERNWAAAAPRLFGPNFLKEAADHLQTLQMVRKVKQQSQPPQQNFRQPPSQGHQGGGGGITAMEAVTILPPKGLSFGEESSPEEEMTSTNRCVYNQYCFNANIYCESYVGESSGYGAHPTTKGRHAFKGGRQASPLCQHLEGITDGN